MVEYAAYASAGAMCCHCLFYMWFEHRRVLIEERKLELTEQQLLRTA